ncbi:MAG: polysaccharide deacetylase family protein [Lachnospiraceae bacterium]
MKRKIMAGAVLLGVLMMSGCSLQGNQAVFKGNIDDETISIISTQASNSTDTDGNIGDNPLTATETAPAIDASKYVGIHHPNPWMDNRIIDNVEELETARLANGNGPAADEYGRPYSALENMEQFAGYQAYFVRDDVTDKILYLTFDAGYEYGCTEQILDTLQEKNVKAVFFVTLPYVESEPLLVQRMIDEGHIVGNHSVSHSSFPSLSVHTQREEVVGLHEYVLENFRYDMWLFRYPKGEYNEQSLAVLNNLGYATVFWSFAYKDYDVNHQPDEEEALEKLLGKMHSGGIYLLHVQSVTNAHILGDFIDEARKQGYEFEQFDVLQENSNRR